MRVHERFERRQELAQRLAAMARAILLFGRELRGSETGARGRKTGS
jgi:hypothetical protein